MYLLSEVRLTPYSGSGSDSDSPPSNSSARTVSPTTEIVAAELRHQEQEWPDHERVCDRGNKQRTLHPPLSPRTSKSFTTRRQRGLSPLLLHQEGKPLTNLASCIFVLYSFNPVSTIGSQLDVAPLVLTWRSLPYAYGSEGYKLANFAVTMPVIPEIPSSIRLPTRLFEFLEASSAVESLEAKPRVSIVN
ncbi:hypothetical protein PMIN01_11010 [Paraphaeosphaeria minitans]|uniref:Uncharacterized protein n=1 Tax=Paraphaeosphaeria minitans TaxID=565426 RepID=A0A9P6KLW0_9PLEO|nr:hypothetical protein PMIN01_11010 [Paraphaeosphaeria minitans]